MKCKSMLAALALLMTNGAVVADTKEFPKFQVADEQMSPQEMVKFARLSAAATILETANLASEKCGVSLDWDAVMATSEEEGITDEVIESPTFKFLSDYQRADAVMRYLKSPVEWCDRIWHLLGPDHPPMIKQPRGFSLALLPPLQPANDLVINAMNDRGRVAGVPNLIDHLLRRVRLTFFIFFSGLA